jgi:hypothetical protein
MAASHTNDVTAVEYPDNAPGDYGEVFDYVVRKGPISHRSICEATPFMSPNQITDALTWLRDRDHLECESGDIEEHGTTATVYYAPA